MTEHKINAALIDMAVPVDTLTPWPGNARIGDLDRIATSLTQNTQYRPILVQASTNQIMAGNQTYRAATQILGWTEVAAQFIHVDDAKAREIVLMDNRAADGATYDDAALYELIKGHMEDGGDLLGTGYDDADLAVLAQVSGALAQDATSFLGEFSPETAVGWDENSQTPETGMVSLVFSMTEAHKAIVVTKLREIQEAGSLDTMVDALVEVCS